MTASSIHDYNWGFKRGFEARYHLPVLEFNSSPCVLDKAVKYEVGICRYMEETIIISCFFLCDEPKIPFYQDNNNLKFQFILLEIAAIGIRLSHASHGVARHRQTAQ